MENYLLQSYSRLRTEDLSTDQMLRAEQDGWTVEHPFSFRYQEFLERNDIDELINDFTQQLTAFHKESTWENLTELGVDYRRLLYLLSNYIIKPSSSCLSLSLECGVAYLYMVAVRGSEHLRIFNTALYSYVLDHLRSAYNTVARYGRPAASPATNKRKKSIKTLQLDNSQHHHHSTNNNDPGNSIAAVITAEEKIRILTSMGYFADVLVAILSRDEVILNAECVDLSVQTLLLLGKLEKRIFLADKNLNQFRSSSEAYVSYKCYLILLNLTPSLEDTIEESVCYVVKRLSPMLKVESDAANKYDSTVEMKKNAVLFFLRQLIVRYEESSYAAMEKLIQYLCYMVPERADVRNKTVPVITDVLSISPTELYHRQIFKILLLCHIDDVKVRTFCLDMATKLLLENYLKERIPTNAVFDVRQPLAAVVNYEFILAVIVFSCRDVSANVKTKVFAGLEKLLDNRLINRVLMRRIFVDPFVNCASLDDSPEYERPIFDTQRYLVDESFNRPLASTTPTQSPLPFVSSSPKFPSEDESPSSPAVINFLPGAKSLVDVLFHFLRVRKVYVRKSALQTLGKILTINSKILNDKITEVLLERCSDVSIMIRKSAAKVLTDLVTQFSDDQSVSQLWVKGVIPLCMEEDTKHQDKILTEFIFPVLFLNLTSFELTKTVLTNLPWNVMKEILMQSKGNYLSHIISKWCTMPQSPVRDRHVENIYTHVGTRNDICAWFLISSLGKIRNLPQPMFVYDRFIRMSGDLNAGHSQFVMEALCGVCWDLERNVQLSLSHYLTKYLLEGDLPLKLISTACDICQMVVSVDTEGEEKRKAIIGWSQPLLDHCESWILNHANVSKQEIRNTEKTARYIVLLGETGNLRSRELKSAPEILENFLLPPSTDEVPVQNYHLSYYIRPAITLCLTKLAMGDERYLPRILPRFKKILKNADESYNLKLNVIHSFCDLSSRHTSMVEPYLVDICECFHSSSEELRIAALCAIIQNLKECYIKVKPWFVHPIFMMMLDESPEILAILHSFLNGDLKHSIFEQFSGFLYYANDYRDINDTWVNYLPASPVTLDDSNTRRILYFKIIDAVPGLTHRIHIWQKINIDVIGKVVEGIIPFTNKKTVAILSDAFYILAENERFIREQTSKSNEDEDLIEDEDAEKEQTTELNATQILNMRTPLLPSAVRYLIAVVKKIKSRREIYDYYLKYITEMRKNFPESCQEIEPLYNTADDDQDSGRTSTFTAAVTP